MVTADYMSGRTDKHCGASWLPPDGGFLGADVPRAGNATDLEFIPVVLRLKPQ